MVLCVGYVCVLTEECRSGFVIACKCLDIVRYSIECKANRNRLSAFIEYYRNSIRD